MNPHPLLDSSKNKIIPHIIPVWTSLYLSHNFHPEGGIIRIFNNSLQLGRFCKALVGRLDHKAFKSCHLTIIPSFHKNLILSRVSFDQEVTILVREGEVVANILEEAVCRMPVEILPRVLLLTNITWNHLEQADVSLDSIQGYLEEAPKDIVGAGDISEGGDEGARQVAGVLTKRTSADWTRFISMVYRGDNLPLALPAEDVA